MKLDIYEKMVLYAFGCINPKNTVCRLKWVTALATDERTKRRILHLARKLDSGDAGEWYPGIYRFVRSEMEGYFEAEQHIRTVETNRYINI